MMVPDSSPTIISQHGYPNQYGYPGQFGHPSQSCYPSHSGRHPGLPGQSSHPSQSGNPGQFAHPSHFYQWSVFALFYNLHNFQFYLAHICADFKSCYLQTKMQMLMPIQ